MNIKDLDIMTMTPMDIANFIKDNNLSKGQISQLVQILIAQVQLAASELDKVNASTKALYAIMYDNKEVFERLKNC